MKAGRPLAILFVALSSCHRAERPVAGEDLNVLFLTVDLLRADFVGLLNPDSDATPNIDRFFHDAVIFEDVSAPGGETAGSSSAVLSALEGLCFPIEPAEARDVGYVTALKMQKARYADRIVGIAETLDEHGFVTVNINQGRRSGRHVGFDSGFRHYVELHHRTLIEQPLDALERELRRVRREKFFVLFHPNTLHASPYRYPTDRAALDAKSVSYTREGDGYDVCLAEEGLEQEERRAWARALYRQQLQYIDDELSRIFELLDQGHVDRTIIVLYSHHGEGLHDNGIPFHGVCYQSCVRVPLLIRHPRIDRQVRIDTPVSLIDLVPTIYEWLGIDVDHAISGVSMVPLIGGGEYEREAIFGKGSLDTYVRQGNWKLIIGQGDELYDLETDPHEEHNLSGQHPEIVDRLKVILMAKERESASLALRNASFDPAGD